MKRITTAIVLLSLFAFTYINHTEKSKAVANQVQGLYIFTDCTPATSYTYLGTVQNGFRFSGSAQYQPVRDKLIKKIKERYPDADGVIFHFVNGAADKADAIKF